MQIGSLPRQQEEITELELEMPEGMEEEEASLSGFRDDDLKPGPGFLQRYAARCHPAWVVPLTLFLWVFMVFALVDAVTEDAAPGVTAAFIACVVYAAVLCFYYIGKWCEYHYASRYPACYWVWHYIFCPIGCMSINVRNATDAVLDTDLRASQRDDVEAALPPREKRSKD